MNQFSLGNAWSKGVSFFSQQALNHAIILIGIGILVPFVLQLALIGNAAGLMSPAMMSQGGLNAVTAMGATFLVVGIINYTLQTGSYFGSWRLGFGEGETLPGAVIYGLIVGVLVIVAFVVIGVVVVLLAQASPVVGLILMAVILLPLFAALYTVLAAVVAIAMFLVLLIMLAFGANMGASNPGFAMMGGGGLALLIMLAIVVVLFWLAARFSCATSVMADRKTFNPMVGITESWRLTSANQWRIMAYLALLGVVLLVLFFLVAAILGAGMMAGLQSGNAPQVGIGSMIMGMIVSIPLAYLVVLVPAGIYRELGGDSEASAKVFA
jgi:hypothetical protein